MFLCLGGFFSLSWFAKHRRKTEPFLIGLFTALSLSYLLHSLTYIFQSRPVFIGALWIDFIVALAGVIFLSVVIGREGIFPFSALYKVYAKLQIAYDKYKFKKNIKKVTKDIRS